jgi:hypothetical protein
MRGNKPLETCEAHWEVVEYQFRRTQPSLGHSSHPPPPFDRTQNGGAISQLKSREPQRRSRSGSLRCPGRPTFRPTGRLCPRPEYSRSGATGKAIACSATPTERELPATDSPVTRQHWCAFGHRQRNALYPTLYDHSASNSHLGITRVSNQAIRAAVDLRQCRCPRSCS